MSQRPHNRTTLEDTTQGSAFHELVVLPTLAPQLARPYRVPGTDIIYNEEFSQNAQVPTEDDQCDTGIDGAGLVTSSQEENRSEPGSVPPASSSRGNQNLSRVFSLYVKLFWTEKQVATGRNGKARQSKQQNLTKAHPHPIPVLAHTRAEFVNAILMAHNLHLRFEANPQSGPDFQIYWKGSFGGKTSAPTIQTDHDWMKLREVLNRPTSSRIVDISVILDSDILNPRFRRVQLGALPAEIADNEEVVLSTKVPELGDFSEDTQALAVIMEELKKEWKCDTDGPCYVMPGGTHVPLNKFRLKAWASEINAGRSIVKRPPTEGLLTQWGFDPSLPPSKPRGRGARSTNHEADPLNQAVDPLTAIVTMAIPLITSLLTKQLNGLSNEAPVIPNPSCGSKRGLDTLDPLASPPSSTSHHLSSSPPPDVQHELEACLSSFGRAKALADDIIRTAIDNLSPYGYTPEVLAGTDIGNQRIEELSKLPEGTVSAMRKFAREWCGEVDAKRARMGQASV